MAKYLGRKMANKKLPFWIYPAHWGLSGQALELAKIDYAYDGVEAELKRADIVYLTEYERELAKNEILHQYGKSTDYEFNVLKHELKYKFHEITLAQFNTKKLELQYEYHVIDEKTFDQQSVELLPEGEDKVLAALKYAHKYHEITTSEFDKEIATLGKDPWFEFNVDFDENQNDVVLTFDYNEYFWKKLKADGHPGNDEYEIIDNFIRDWGRKLATEDYADQEGNLKILDEDTTQTTGITDAGFKIYK